MPEGCLAIKITGGSVRQAQHPLEGSLEVGVTQGVQDGVQGRVEVAEPRGRGEEGLVDALLLAAVGDHHEQGEVGQPAQYEGPHYDPQLGGCLLLLGQNQVGVGLDRLLKGAGLGGVEGVGAAVADAEEALPALAALGPAQEGKEPGVALGPPHGDLGRLSTGPLDLAVGPPVELPPPPGSVVLPDDGVHAAGVGGVAAGLSEPGPVAVDVVGVDPVLPVVDGQGLPGRNRLVVVMVEVALGLGPTAWRPGGRWWRRTGA